jgi:hypothetical protein
MAAKRFSFNAGSISIRTEAHWLTKSDGANKSIELKSEMKRLDRSPGSMAHPNESTINASWRSKVSVCGFQAGSANVKLKERHDSFSFVVGARVGK